MIQSQATCYKPFFPSLTKIVVTLGPKSHSVEAIEACLSAGMSVARFDFSWLNAEYHLETLDNLRTAMKNVNKLCAGPSRLVGAAAAKNERVSAEKGQAKVEGDDSDTVTAAHEIGMWPPSNLDILREEGDNMDGTGTGGERHVEELRGRESDNRDEPATVSFAHETEMWPPSNVNISREEVDNMEGTGTGGERHVEELRGRESDNRGEPATVSAEHEIEMWPPSNVIVSRVEVDDMEGTGTEGERHVEELRGRESDNRDEPATVTAEHEIEIEMWPPSNVNVSRVEVDDMEGTGTGGERHVEELRGRESDNCDEPTTVTAEHEIEMWPPTSTLDISREEGDNMEGTGTEEERHVEEVRGRELDNCDTELETKIKYTFSVEGKGDIIRDIGMVEEEKPMQVERGAEESEERGEIEGKENGKEKNNEQQDIGISEYPSTVNDHMQIGTVNFEGEEKPMKVMCKVEEKKAEEGKEIQGLATAVTEVNLYQNNSCPFTEMITKENDHEIGQTILSSKHTSTVEKENGTVVKEAKPPEMVLEGRTDGTEDKVQDVPPAALETKEQLPTVHSLTAVPEEPELDFQLPGMSSPHALPPMSNIDGDSTKAVEEGKTMIGIGEIKAANEVKVLGQEDIETTESNHVIMTVVSIECKSVVDQSAAEQNKNEGGVETYEPTVASEKAEGGVMEAEYCRSAATSHIVEPLMTVYHSFVAETSLECVSENEPSNLSTDYASAVEDQSSDLTDAECGPTAAVVEIAELVHSGDEVFYREDMIWEQIYAMRIIVGYKADLHSSPVEELKALYLFTGVEPPVSLEDTSDIMEIGDKLKFLKSIIGVK